MHMKQSSRGNPALHLKNGIKYIMREEKTGGGIWIGGTAGTTPNEVYQTFLDTKKSYGKCDGRQGYHFVISFKEDTSSDAVYSVIRDFCKEYLGECYDYVYAVHTDTAHPHAHVIFNSVSRLDGLKYHYKKGDWEKYIQKITDKVCEKYGFDKFEYEGGEHQDYGQWLREKKGKPNWRDTIRNDIDQLIKETDSYQELLSELFIKGYKIRTGNSKIHGEYLSMMPDGGRKAVRSYQLGKGYQIEDIKKRIQNREKIDLVKPDKRVKPSWIKAVKWKGEGLPKRQFFVSPYQYYYVRQFCKNSVLYRYQNTRNYDDIRNTERMAQICRYLLTNGITSQTRLEERSKNLKEKSEHLWIQRNSLYRNPLSEEEMDAAKRYQGLCINQERALKDGDDTDWETIQDKREELEAKYPMEMLKNFQAEKDRGLHEIKIELGAIRAEEKMIERILTTEKGSKEKGAVSWKNTPIQPKR